MDNKFLYNNKKLMCRRKELRNNQTEAETRLWSQIQRSQIGGFKFIRQYSIGSYILDFYCPKIRLAVELDGSQHSEDEAILYDKDREQFLKSIDVKTIRFWNNEVLGHMENVLEKIYKEALNLKFVSPLKVRGASGARGDMIRN